ncbi:MAG: DNA phosphorothioation-associated protein 4 [Victivallaceae bacterium]|nr:DNA phosphorothioation-associated protein 4 [Victivallaceae bacterium]
MSNVNFDRRIRPPKEFSQLLDNLTDGKNGIFNSKAELLLFSASLAYSRNKRKPLKNTGEGIRFSVFENLRFGSIVLDTIVFAETKDGNIFKSESLNEYANIFEEYAHAGLEIINDEIYSTPGDNIPKVISLIQKVQDISKNANDDILASFDLGL